MRTLLEPTERRPSAESPLGWAGELGARMGAILRGGLGDPCKITGAASKTSKAKENQGRLRKSKGNSRKTREVGRGKAVVSQGLPPSLYKAALRAL